jgi:hypothetical protein
VEAAEAPIEPAVAGKSQTPSTKTQTISKFKTNQGKAHCIRARMALKLGFCDLLVRW